jgi:hypothetical protein
MELSGRASRHHQSNGITIRAMASPSEQWHHHQSNGITITSNGITITSLTASRVLSFSPISIFHFAIFNFHSSL